MLQIRQLEIGDLAAVRRFTDREIGAGYYAITELQGIFERSKKNGIMCSLVLFDQDCRQVKGVRLTYPPGQWEHGKGSGMNQDRWPHAFEHTAYFQSLFVASDLQGQGWGGRMSLKALEFLREVGARGVVCHSWKESPHNSSTKYLQKMGFAVVAEHPLYWKNVKYNCTRCLKPPCQCTSVEMYLNLERDYEHIVLA